MHTVCSFTSKYFPFYDKYEHVHYDNDDDDHVWHDIREFGVPSDVWLQSTNSTM